MGKIIRPIGDGQVYSEIDIDNSVAEDFSFETRESLGVREITEEDINYVNFRAAAKAASDAEELRGAQIYHHVETLQSCRALLLEYQFGAPGTPSFLEVLGPVQTAILDYRDSGIKDPVCDEHIMWINARVNEINAMALYGAGVLK